jgi:hypothetical protein
MGPEARDPQAVRAADAIAQDRPHLPGLETRHRLTQTEREPVSDIEAQLAALRDPDHPKRAVWISGKAPAIPVQGLPPRLYLDAGTLIASREDGARLLADPTEETLSQLLGYVESKTEAIAGSLPSEPLVVQARDQNDAVVLEMLSSLGRFREAAIRAGTQGKVCIMTMTACLNRRQRLIAEEARAAVRPLSAGQRSG